MLLVAAAYPEWTKIGGGTMNFLTFGGYGTGPISSTASYLFPRGIISDLDLGMVRPLDPAKITEQVTRSWYAYAEGTWRRSTRIKGRQIRTTWVPNRRIRGCTPTGSTRGSRCRAVTGK